MSLHRVTTGYLGTYHVGRPIVLSSRPGKAIGRPGRTAHTISIETLGIFFSSRFGAYLAAGSKVLALGGDTLVVVDVVLPAVLGLVLVREAGVEAWLGHTEG